MFLLSKIFVSLCKSHEQKLAYALMYKLSQKTTSERYKLNNFKTLKGVA